MLFNDLVDPAELTGFVRELPVPEQVALNRYLPDRLVPDIEAKIDQLIRTNRAAKFRSFDAETPVGKRDSLQVDKILMPPLGQKTVVGEEERLRINQLQGMSTDALVRQIYDDADVNARAVRIRMELARGDVLQDGKFTLTAENGLTLEADFGVPAGNIVNASVVWSTVASADVLGDLTGWLDTYRAAGGVPGKLVVSTTGMRYMLQNAGLRALAANQGITPSMMRRTQLNDVLAEFDIPPIEVYDGQFDVDGATTRAIAADRLLMLPANPADLGYTAWGITAEALELAEAQRLSLDSAPGLVAVVMKEGDPVRTWTKVGATGLPILTNPRRLLVADIY